MSNGTPALSGTNLTHPTSGNTEIIRDIKGAIKSVAVLGLKEIFNSEYSAYHQFQDLKIEAEFPETDADFPCIVVLLRNLEVRQAGLERVQRKLYIHTSEGDRILREERRVFTANLVLYHAAYTTGEMNYLSDAIADAITFDPGRFLVNYVDANIPGIAYASDRLPFGGENQEVSPEGRRYIYSDSVSIPIWGEVIMRAWHAMVDGVEVLVALIGPDRETIIQDYPEGWDW